MDRKTKKNARPEELDLAPPAAQPSKAHQQQQKQKDVHQPKKSRNKYCVVVRNAEQDLGRIHAALVKQLLFCDESAIDVALCPRSETHTVAVTLRERKEKGGTDETTSSARANPLAVGSKRPREEEQDDGEAVQHQDEGQSKPSNDKLHKNQRTSITNVVEAVKANPTILDVTVTIKDPLTMKHCKNRNEEEVETKASTTKANSSSTVSSKTLQANLASAIVTPSVTAITDVRVTKILQDVEGFVGCWKTKSQNGSRKAFRVVFESQENLFAAKALLDEFEAEPGLRLVVQLGGGGGNAGGGNKRSEEYNAWLSQRASDESAAVGGGLII